MEWRQADVFRLIDEYKERQLLWDATMDDFKNRNKRHDAWSELDEKFAVETGDSEKKIRKLISQFNRECKNVYKSGRGAEENTKWIYFKSLLFLKDKNKPRTSIDGGFADEDFDLPTADVDDVISQIEDGDVAPEGLPPPSITDSSVAGTSAGGAISKPSPASARARASRKTSNESMAEEAYMVMKGVAVNKGKRDEFDAFGDSVAMTLRKLSSISATYAKFEIKKILFQAELGQYEQPLSRPMTSATYTSAMLTPPIDSPNVHQSSATRLLSINTKPPTAYYSPDNQQHGQSPSLLDSDNTEFNEVLYTPL